MMRFTTFALLLATTATATADDAQERLMSTLTVTFNKFAEATQTKLRDPVAADNRGTPDFCASRIPRAKEQGLTDATVFVIAGQDVPLAKIDERVCQPYVRAYYTVEAAHMLAEVTDGRKCIAQMDELLKHGIGDATVKIKGADLKLADAKAKLCEPLRKAQPPTPEELEAAREAIAAPYKKAGITGEKLNVCINHNVKLRGEGGTTITPEQIKKASVVFVLNGNTVMRIAFKGDAIDTVSEKQYPSTPTADAFH